MTSKDFVTWLKGFTEACNDLTATPKQWDRIKEVLYEVEDSDINLGLDAEIDDWYGALEEPKSPLTGVLSGSASVSFTVTSGSSGDSSYISSTVWNDKMGTWHYTNSQEKKQLLD